MLSGKSKVCLMGFVVAVASLTVGVAWPPATSEAPCGVVGVDVTKHLGSIGAHQPVEASLTLRNIGPGRARILRVLPDCGCVLIKPHPTIIEEGGEVTVGVLFEPSRGLDPSFRKTVTIVTAAEDGERKDIARFTILGLVERNPGLAVWPGNIDYGNIYAGTTGTKTIYLRSYRQAPRSLPSAVRLDGFKPETIHLHCDKQEQLFGFARCDLEVQVHPGAPAGLCETTLTIKVDGSSEQTITIPIRATVIAREASETVGSQFLSGER